METAFSPLAMLLGGIKQAVANPAAIKAVPTNPKAMPAAAIPGALSGSPQTPFSVTALPDTTVMPTLRTFVPNAMPKPEPAPVIAPAITPAATVAQNRRGVLERNLADAVKPINRDDYKPKWTDRLRGGLAAFSSSLGGNPNAIAIGRELTSQRFNRAEYQRQQKVKGAQEELEAFDRGEKQRNEIEDNAIKMQDFAMRRSNAERQNKLADAQIANYESEIRKRDKEAPEKLPTNLDQAWYKSFIEQNKREPNAKEINDYQRGKAQATHIVMPKDKNRNEYDDWHDAFVRDNGREPTAEEIVNRKPKGGSAAAGTFKDANAVTKWDQQWYANMRDKVRKDKMAAKNTNADADAAQSEYGLIEQQYAEEARKHEEQKKQIYDHLKAGRTVTVNGAGEVSASGGNSAPAKANAPAKSATKAEVEAFAKATKRTAAEVEKQLKSQGYEIK